MVMNRRDFLKALALGSVAMTLPGCRSTNEAATPPNILFIMADDMGYGDPHCYNPASKIPTPHIDQLAREGMRFTDAHAPASVCIPSRYGLLTGRYPFRISRDPAGSLIAPERMTIASLLHNHGYHTGMVGKWHLGFDGGTSDRDFSKPMQGGPVDHGFDYYFGIPASLDIPPYYYIQNDHCVNPPTGNIAEHHSEGVTPIQGAFWRGGHIAPGFSHKEVLPKFTEKACQFLQQHQQANASQPFFLYLALAAPHTPWMPLAEYQGRSKAGDYGDYMTEVDACVGQVLQTIDDLRLRGETLVIFTSDNGPVWYDQDVQHYHHDSAGGLRGMKGDAWEAGHRMPFIARWPKNIEAGSTSDEVISFTDMLATFSAIVGADLPENAGEDSYNILPVLLGTSYTKPLREATVFYSSRRFYAIRKGPWKLIQGRGSGGFSVPHQIKPAPGEPAGQLYNLKDDPDESKNLYQSHPEIVQSLTKLLEQYKASGRSRPTS